MAVNNKGVGTQEDFEDATLPIVEPNKLPPESSSLSAGLDLVGAIEAAKFCQERKTAPVLLFVREKRRVSA